MFAFICCFFPAVVGVWIFEVLSKKRLTVRQCIYRYCGYTLAANFVYTAVKMFVLKTATSPILVDAEMIPSVAFHYLIVVIPAVLLFVFGELNVMLMTTNLVPYINHFTPYHYRKGSIVMEMKIQTMQVTTKNAR